MNSIIVIGLGYGDEGKGSIVDSLTRHHNSRLNVRFNGGAQAAHNVICSDGRHHTFHQFGSGTLFNDKVCTYLSKYMLFNPLAVVHEIEDLEKLGCKNLWDRLYVHRNSIITTPYHMAMNRIKETLRGDDRHGSCGMGIGETVADSLKSKDLTLRAHELKNRGIFIQKLNDIAENKQKELQEFIKDIPDFPFDKHSDLAKLLVNLSSEKIFEDTVVVYDDLARNKLNIVGDTFLNKYRDETVIFEGAQGVLLDEEFGEAPYYTWSDTTQGNAVELCKDKNWELVGVTRAYATRHGAGPLKTEDSNLAKILKDTNNPTNLWQKEFRFGTLDFEALFKSIDIIGKNKLSLAVTHLDQWDTFKNFDIDEDVIHNAAEWCEFIGESLKVPVSIRSYGNTAEDKVYENV